MYFEQRPFLEPSLADILGELVSAVETAKPGDILQFCIDFLQRKVTERRQHWTPDKMLLDEGDFQPHPPHPCDLRGHPVLSPLHPQQTVSSTRVPLPTLQASTYEPYSSEDDDDDDEVGDEDDTTAVDMDDLFRGEKEDVPTDLIDFTKFQASHQRGRRTSVSAESLSPSCQYVKTVVPKTEAQCERIHAAMQHNFLFKNLDQIQLEDVINAMTEKAVDAHEVVIEQGAIGDYFYIVESGQLDCYIDGVKMQTYTSGGSFGELALMYNSPRAATIVCVQSSVLWALDRVTFRQILMENTSQKRKMYESFLCEVPLFASLDAYERYKIADALETVEFEHGDVVIQQGMIGHNFYLIEAGEAVFFKEDPQDGLETEVNRLTKGDYFGELALLNDSPRAATVVAQGKLRCATLGKKGFSRLLGPVLDILKRNSENYARVMQASQK